MNLNNVLTFGSLKSLFKDTLHEILLKTEKINSIVSGWNKGCVEDASQTMTVGSRFKVAIPLFPVTIIFELAIIIWKTFDAAL